MCPYDDGSRNEGDLQRRKNFRRNGRSDPAGAAEKTEGTASVDGSTGYHGGCEPGACQNPRFRNRTIPPENKDRDGADIISDIAVSGAQNETFSYTEKEWRITIMNVHYRNLLGGLYRENPVKSRNYEAVKSSKKWENVGNSYIIPALLLYRYSYI